MRILWKKVILGAVLLNISSYAGGKNVAPAEEPIAIIEENTSAWYLGGGLVWAKLHGCNLTDCSYEDVTYGVMLRGGYEFNQYFGIEARGVYTFLDEGPFGGTPLQHIGLYSKPQYPLSDHSNIYALLGYGYTKNLGNGARLNYFDHDNGFSAGLGLEYDLSSSADDKIKNTQYNRRFDGYSDQGYGWSIFLDYQRLLIKSNVPDMDTIIIGVRYDF